MEIIEDGAMDEARHS